MSGVLSATLTKAVLYRRVSLTLRALLVAGAGASVALCALFAADNLVNLSVPVRTAFGLAFLLAGGTGLVRLYWRVWRAPIPVHRVAVYLEQRYGIADNRLINAVRFAQDESLPAPLLASFTAAAERTCATLDLRRIWQHARLRQALQLSGACLLLTLAYVIPFRAHARNALLRFLHPDTAPDPLAFTQFAVSPGDTERPEGGACAILARATRNGKPAARLDIVVDDGRGALLYPMRTTPGGMAFDLRDLTRDTRYAIRSGRDSSRWHTVRVRRRPKPETLTVTVTPPAYTGAKPWSLNADARESGILNGSRIAIRSGVPAARNPLFRLDGATHAAPDFAFVLQADCAVTLDLTDARGMTHPAVWSCRFTRVNDRPPEVRFLNRDLNVRAGFGDSLTLSLEWQDDYGVTALELYTLHEQREVPLKRLTFREFRRTRADVCALPVTREMFAPNARYRIRARVLDNHLPPQAGITATPVTLHVGDPGPAAVTGDPNDPHVRLFGTLTEALELQKPLRDWVAARIGADRRERVTPVLRARQEAVHQRILLGASLATDLLRQRQIRKTLADRIAELVTAHSEPLVSRIPALADLPDAPRQAALNTLVLRQTDLIGALQRILGLISQEKAEAELAARKLETAQQEQKMPERLEALKKGLEAFQEAERKLLTGLEAIDPREPEDWTEEEEKLLGIWPRNGRISPRSCKPRSTTFPKSRTRISRIRSWRTNWSR